MSWYVCVHMKITPWNNCILNSGGIQELFTCKVCEMFVYKHTKTIECTKNSLFLEKTKTWQVNDSRILRI